MRKLQIDATYDIIDANLPKSNFKHSPQTEKTNTL